MKVIAGLGNPGTRYAHTRHNAGFDALDRLAAQQGWAWEGQRHHAQVANGALQGEKVLLAKPQTYMNESGLAVGALVRFYKLDPAHDLLVLCDDMDLPLGRVRVRAQGAAGGQHGLESILAHLGTQRFARIRIGVGRPPNGRGEHVDFLLSAPRGDERITLDAAIERAAEAALCWLTSGTEVAMNTYNG